MCYLLLIQQALLLKTVERKKPEIFNGLFSVNYAQNTNLKQSIAEFQVVCYSRFKFCKELIRGIK